MTVTARADEPLRSANSNGRATPDRKPGVCGIEVGMSSLRERREGIFAGHTIRVDTLRAPVSDLSSALVPSELRDMSEYPKVVAATRRACVKIFTPGWHGAGFFVSSDGYLLTSYHVVAGAGIAIILTASGQLFSVDRVAAFSQANDLALLKLNAAPLDWIRLKPEHDIRIGDPIYAVGHPARTSWQVAGGRVSERGTFHGARLIQFAADLERGNSGGPIVDENGRLCAVAAYSATLPDGTKSALGISSDAVEDFLQSRTHGETTLSKLGDFDWNMQILDLLVNTIFVSDAFISELDPARRRQNRPSEPTALASLSAVDPDVDCPSTLSSVTKLLLLQFFIERHLAHMETEPGIASAIQDLSSALRLYSRAFDPAARSSQPASDRTNVNEADLRNAAAAFCHAIAGARARCNAYEIPTAAPDSCRRLDLLNSSYRPFGGG